MKRSSQNELYLRLQEIVVTPASSAGAIYAAGDALGGLLTFPYAVAFNGGSGSIVKVVIVDDAQQLAPIDIVFFNQTFTVTADNAPFTPTDADMQNCIGYIDMLAADYANFVNNSVACKTTETRLPFPFRVADSGTSLYAQMVVRATPTYVAVDDLTIKLTIDQY
jgi:hypothetical protein